MADIHKWEGFSELEHNLKLLGAEMHEKGVKRMMRGAAVPMRDDAKRLAPVLKEPDPRRRAGLVRDRIRIWRKRGTKFAVTYYVGVAGISRSAVRRFKKSSGKGAGDNPNDPFYWRWQELGNSKQAPANGRGFLRPAFESRKMESVRVALDEGRKFVKGVRLKRLRNVVKRGLEA